MLERQYPKVVDSKGIEHDALCFGNYSSFPCGGLKSSFKTLPPCQLAERCRNATPVRILDNQSKGLKFIMKPNGIIVASNEATE
jgi:hypothetical protein